MRFPFRRKALTASPAVVEAAEAGQLNTYRRLGGVNQQVQAAWLQSQSMSYAYMYERQPAVRKVVDYIARNTAQLGLKLYERVSDTERERDTDHPAAQTMAHPNDLGPADQFVFNFVADFLVHENAYALKFRSVADGPRTLIQLPPPAVAVNSSARFTIESYRIYRSDGSFFDVAPSDVIHWRGYNPSDPRIGISQLETLRQILAEDAASQAANIELLKSGLSKPGYIKRPLDAPEWSEKARERFQESWANQAKKSPRKSPVLEEGMEFAGFGLSPKDAEMLDGRRFTNDEVASLYGMEHCPPQDDDERKQFIADVLAPLTKSLAEQLCFSLLEAEYGEDNYYFEFDLNEKLRGDIENRFAAITAAVGAPWLLRNEARALENRPAVDGGDELITPLNVIEGDNPRPAPNVMPPQDPNGPPQDGSHREMPAKALHPRRNTDIRRQHGYIGEAKTVIDRFRARQERAVKSKGTLDTARWNKELTEDLDSLITDIVGREGAFYNARLAGDGFNFDEVRDYVKAMAKGIAEHFNAATARDAADGTIQEALDRVANERAAIMAASVGTRAAVFARQEAAKQAPGTEHRMQVWIADTERHAELDGVAVPLDSDWGGISPGSEPNCACSAAIE